MSRRCSVAGRCVSYKIEFGIFTLKGRLKKCKCDLKRFCVGIGALACVAGALREREVHAREKADTRD